MSRHDPIVQLRDMLDHAREAWQLVVGRRREDLDRDRLLNLALVRLLEVVGEAAARIPPQDRERFQGIPWRDIVDLRNRLIHGYNTVNFDILWAIVQQDLPPLISQLRHILKTEEQKREVDNAADVQ